MILDDEKPVIESAEIPKDIQDKFEDAVPELSGLVLVNTYSAWKAANSTKDYIELIKEAAATCAADTTAATQLYDVFIEALNS